MLRGLERRPGLALGVLLAVQALISLPRLTGPFLEGRSHWNQDSALFLRLALHSRDRTLYTPLQAFGLKRYRYDEDGRIAGFSHYPHHPVLNSTLFSLYARMAGYHEWVPRSYGLILALLTSVLLFGLLREATGEVQASAALLLLYILLPLNFNYQDAWKHELLVTLLCMACLRLLPRLGSAGGRGLFLAAFFLLFQSGWAAYPFGGLLLLHLFLKRRDAFRPALAAAAASALLNFGLLHLLGFTPERVRGQFAFRAGGGLAGVSPGEWLAQQAGFLGMNFTWPVLLLGAAAALLALRRGRRAPPAGVFGLMFMASALSWLLVFRHQSYTVPYVSWLLGPACVLLLADAWAMLPRQAALLGLLPVLAFCLHKSYRLETGLQFSMFADADDMRAIRRQDRRLVVSPGELSGPRDWWVSPHVEFYTDPVLKAWSAGAPPGRVRGGMVFLDRLSTAKPAGDVFVALNTPGGVRGMKELCRERFGIRDLAVQYQASQFVFLVAK